ncbi:MAG: DNA polymerase/3'-5' exonuclease PolX [Pseudomonadota bacterium]
MTRGIKRKVPSRGAGKSSPRVRRKGPPPRNDEIAALFDEIADLLEIESANPFRVRAYRQAARTLRGLDRPAADLLAEGRDLTELPGIGEDLAGKIAEIVETGHSAMLDRLHGERPAGLVELLRVPGIGPKRAKLLHDKLGIASLAGLERAAAAGKLEGLPGFGAKSIAGIAGAAKKETVKPRRLLLAAATPEAEALVKHLEGAAGLGRCVVAGSYRRARETVGDLDILATARDSAPVIERFVAYDRVAKVLAKGPTRATVVLASGLQVDLRVVPTESYGAALVYFTGSKAHNIAIRKIAQARGLKINEYGVFKGDRAVAGESEESVYRAVGLRFIPPELREDQGEVEAARKGPLPTLVELGDLKGDLHCHSKASDGQATIAEMAEAARRHGLSYLAVTEHSRRLGIAHGLDARRLGRQIDEIDRLNEKLKGVRLLKGIEVDILENGELDLPDTILKQLDLVIGAVHGAFNLPPEKQTARLLRAMEHPHFSILAHPEGRLLGSREAMRFDMARVIEQARQRGCFLELNAQPERLDLTEVYARAAKEAGVLVAIGSDAHRPSDFANLRFGVGQARRGWLEPANVLNTRPLAELKRLLAATM